MDYEFAPSTDLPSLHEHPIYTKGVEQIANAQWIPAFQSLQLLKEIYPNDAEVKELLDQVEMRAALARFQPKQSSRAIKRPSRRRLVILLLLAIVVGIAAYAAYGIWVDPIIIQEMRVRQISNLRTEADEAMAAGDYARARQSLERLQAIYPEDTQTFEELGRIEQVERLSVLYSEANTFMAEGNWDQAIETLTELQGLDAEYRDLSQLLRVAQESQAMERQFQVAEEAFVAGNWASAIAQYEALQQANLTFRFDDIQDRLFQSHLKYGQTILEGDGTDPNHVSQAISHFSVALKLRPMDTEALNERRLAEGYLTALNSEDQDEAIDLLQMIYDDRPSYAGNQVAQLLYIALLGRAESALTAGDEATAISAYQVAAQLSVEDPSEAQEKLADLMAETTSQ